MRDPRERLQDILEAIDHIERYTARGREVFEQDELIQNWFIRHLQIISEAARGLPQEMRDRTSQVPWSKITGVRHILVHEYFEIDKDVVWSVVVGDLPHLKQRIERALNTLEKGSKGK